MEFMLWRTKNEKLHATKQTNKWIECYLIVCETETNAREIISNDKEEENNVKRGLFFRVNKMPVFFLLNYVVSEIKQFYVQFVAFFLSLSS